MSVPASHAADVRSDLLTCVRVNKAVAPVSVALTPVHWLLWLFGQPATVPLTVSGGGVTGPTVKS